jgi:hypothetical protein
VIVLNLDAAPVLTFTIRIMKVSAEFGMEGVLRSQGGILDLPNGLTDGEVVTVCSPVDHPGAPSKATLASA